MKANQKLRMLILFCITQFIILNSIHAQQVASSSQLTNGTVTFSSTDEKLPILKEQYMQLKEKYDALVKDQNADTELINELQKKIEILQIQIAERTARQNSFLEEEKRQIERETGYVYSDNKTIADALKAYEPGNVSKELNKLKLDLLKVQAEVERDFRILSEDDKAHKKTTIQNLQKQIKKLEFKLN